MRHLLLTAIYAACLATFFASLLREDRRSALRLGLTIFGVMVLGAWLLGWAMLLVAP